MDDDLRNLKIDRSQRRPAASKWATAWIIAGVLVLLALGAWEMVAPRLNAALLVEVEHAAAIAAADAPNGVVLNATGYIVAAHKIELAAKVVGKVRWIGVDKADRVQEGQVLVRLEDDEYQASVQQARGQLTNLQAKLDEAMHGSRPEEIAEALANLNSAKADLENARVSLDRARNTVRESVGSKQSLDDAQGPTELDALFARDQFEERPLIWKAHWLRTHQRLEEAEQTARKAISIDPTDGEEGPGDRLRAYAELAEIRAAQGDTNEAATLRGAVEAVHEAELADQFNSAGLLKQALARYQDSLTKFADAYCIHARLAVLLSDLGQHEQAAEHYRRAYELMPDSFGRVESYCFGCQRTFDGERAQSIAETVFARLVKETPNKPQVHYMLGYLRDEEGRYQEALASYRVAVKLDSDYLNAWVKIESLNEHVFQSAAERDTVVFNLLRLDPQGQHASPSFELVSDLAALWNNVAAANAKLLAKPESLYLLPASKAEIEKQEAQAGNQGWRERMEYIRSFQESAEAMTPGKAVAQNGFIQTAQRLLSREAASGMEE